MSLSRTQFLQSASVGTVFAIVAFAGLHVGRAVGNPDGPAAATRPVAQVAAAPRPDAAPAAPAASTRVTACANRKSGALRIPPAGRCTAKERAVSWAATGPRGAKGDKGDRGARGAAGSVSINGGKCSETQYIGYDGEKWTCVSAPISAFLHSDGSNINFSSVEQGFKAFSANVVADSGCNKETCLISLYDVVDHETCSAEVRGAPFASKVDVLPSPGNVLLDFGSAWDSGQSLTISLYCLR